MQGLPGAEGGDGCGARSPLESPSLGAGRHHLGAQLLQTQHGSDLAARAARFSWASIRGSLPSVMRGPGTQPTLGDLLALARRLAVPLVTGDRQVLAAFPDVAVDLEEVGATAPGSP